MKLSYSEPDAILACVTSYHSQSSEWQWCRASPSVEQCSVLCPGISSFVIQFVLKLWHHLASNHVHIHGLVEVRQKCITFSWRVTVYDIPREAFISFWKSWKLPGLLQASWGGLRLKLTCIENPITTSLLGKYTMCSVGYADLCWHLIIMGWGRR